MNILIIGKYPPIQGGVSTLTYNTAYDLAKKGNNIHIVTNANEVEKDYKQVLLNTDLKKLQSNFKNGYVKLHYIEQLEYNFNYPIPYSTIQYSRLLGKSIGVVEEYKEIDLIIGWYLEPYAVIASHISILYNIPLIIIHAGSDIANSLLDKSLYNTYKKVCEIAKYIITDEDITNNKLLNGVDNVKKIYAKEILFIPDNFKTKLKLDLTKYSTIISQKTKNRNVNLKSISTNSSKDITVLGIYGKLGHHKGSFILIDALAKLKTDFRFLTIPLSDNHTLNEYYEKIKNSNMAKITTIIPPLPPWRIPEFLNSCDIVFFLENNFGIFHTSRVPYEILKKGKCLIISKDYVEHSDLKQILVNNINCIIIDEIDEQKISTTLKKILKDKEKLAKIKLYAAYTYSKIEAKIGEKTLADIIIKHTNYEQ